MATCLEGFAAFAGVVGAGSAAYSALRDREPDVTRYDVILNLESLSDIAKSGRVEVWQETKCLFNIAEEKRCKIIAFVGLFDKGKTFLINKLFDVKLPTGSGVVTKGLSFHWVPQRNMLILDSAGVQTPVKSTQASATDGGAQDVIDAEQTEKLTFEMISRIAHHIVFVVDNLTAIEQKYIQELHNMYQCREERRELIVVHNMRSVTDVKDAERIWNEQVVTCYADGTRREHLAQLVYIEHRGAGCVHHYGMCKEGFAAGIAVNLGTLRELRNALEHREASGEKVVLLDIFVKILHDLLPNFVKVDADSLPGGWNLTYKVGGEGRFKENYKLAGEIQLPQGAKVSMKTEGDVSDGGHYISYNSSFDPIINAYEDASLTPMRRYITIECPGVDKNDIVIEELGNGIRVEITKRKHIDESRFLSLLRWRQPSGMWSHDFTGDRWGCFKCQPDEMTMKNGIFTMILIEKPSQRRRFGAAASCDADPHDHGAASASLPAGVVAPSSAVRAQIQPVDAGASVAGDDNGRRGDETSLSDDFTHVQVEEVDDDGEVTSQRRRSGSRAVDELMANYRMPSQP